MYSQGTVITGPSEAMPLAGDSFCPSVKIWIHAWRRGCRWIYCVNFRRGGVVGDILTLEVYLSTILKLLKIKHWRKKNYIPTFNKNIVFIFKWMLILHFSSQPICLVFYFWIIGLNCCLCKLFITCIFIFCTRLWKWCKHRLKM